MRNRNLARVAAIAAVSMVLAGCIGDSDDEPDARTSGSTGQQRSAGPCKDADPAPPVSPDVIPAQCHWWTEAEDIVGFDDLVIITAEEQPGRFTMSAVRAETGERQWTTPPIEAVADRAKGGERTLQIVHWHGQPYAAFQYRTGDRNAATFVPLSYGADRTPVTWPASEKDSVIPHGRAAIDGVVAAVVNNVVPPPWVVVDPTSATTTRLPTSASEEVQAIGDGWFAQGNVDGFTFTVRRYDGSLAWDPANFVPDGANPRGTREAVAAYGDYLLARWIKSSGEGTGAGRWLLAVHDKTGKPIAATEFGAFGHDTKTEPADRLVVSANQRWLVVHSGQESAAIDVTGGKATTLEPGLRPVSVTDDGVVYAINLDGVAVRVDGATGRPTWTGQAGSLLPAATVDGIAVVSSTRPETILADRHGTATAWAFGSARAATARRLAPMVWLAAGDDSGPTDASLFVAHSQLMWAHDNGCLQDLVVKTVDESALAHGAYRHRATVDRNPTDLIPCTEAEHTGPEYRSNQNTHPNRSQEVPGREGFYLDLDNDYREGLGPGAPMYWEFHPGENGKGAYVYWLFYAYNDYTNKHEGDWERIAIQVDGDTPTGVAFWKHEQPTCRLPWDRLERTEDGHPIIYSAKDAHGSYARVGHYPHPGGTDEASQGKRWHTWENAKDVKAQRWYGYGGGWGAVAPIEFFSGPDGPNPLYDKASAALTDERCGEYEGEWVSTEPVSPPLPRDSRVELAVGEGAVGEIVGKATYPQAACTGQLRKVESTPDKVVLTQTIVSDQSLMCAKEGTVTLTMAGEDIDYSYQPKGEQTTHTARLKRR